jgi:hypothetical protein
MIHNLTRVCTRGYTKCVTSILRPMNDSIFYIVSLLAFYNTRRSNVDLKVSDTAWCMYTIH